MATNERSLNQLMDELDREEAEFRGDPEAVAIAVDIESGDYEEEGVTFNEDGSVEVDLDTAEEWPFPEEHDGNLAEFLPQQELKNVAMEIIQDVTNDLQSRADWEKSLRDALKQLGLKIEDKNKPWPGACSAVHPLLLESVVRFQAQTIGDILPAGGPVRGSVVGIETAEKVAQAFRVERHMNYVLTEEMPEYRPETERLLFGMGVEGSGFRKVFPDPVKNRPRSVYINAYDLIVNYEATDILTAERVTHRQRLSENRVKALQISGWYRDIELQDAVRDTNQTQDAVDRLVGQEPVDPHDTRRVIYETQCEWDFGEHPEGLALPYVITVDRTNQEVLAIRRNWEQGDETYEALQHIVHYELIPGMGFYAFGYAHLVGNTAKAATSILQQLVDAGTLSNLPGGLKTRGLRMKNENEPILPGEWRDVDVPSNKISDNIYPIPSKEPSATLFQLMQSMVQDGRNLASMADLKVSEMNQEAPVGTTLAILERAMKVQTAIQQRIHASLRNEFKILARVIRDLGEPSYPYDVEPYKEIKEDDYDDRIDVIPVADPNASSLTQRVMMYQAALTAAQQAPDVYDQQKLHRNFVEAIGLMDAKDIVPTPEEIPAADPVSENSTLMNGGSVDAKEYQDHDAHLRVHLAMRNDPQLQMELQQSPMGQSIMGALDAHVRQHLAFQYRRQIEQELGVPLPPLGQPIPEDVEKRLSTLAADAADQLTGKKMAQQQAEQNAAMSQDPVIQQKERELGIREAEVQRKAQKDQMDDQARARKEQLDAELERMRLAQQERIAAADREQRREKEILEELNQLAGRQSDEVMEGARIGLEASRVIAEAQRQQDQGSDGG